MCKEFNCNFLNDGCCVFTVVPAKISNKQIAILKVEYIRFIWLRITPEQADTSSFNFPYRDATHENDPM